MDRYLDSLKQERPEYRVEQAAEGFVLVRRSAECPLFDTVAREVIEHAGADYVALPVTDGGVGYDRVIVLPL
jgi:hypothetical protein